MTCYINEHQEDEGIQIAIIYILTQIFIGISLFAIAITTIATDKLHLQNINLQIQIKYSITNSISDNSQFVIVNSTIQLYNLQI